MNVNIVIIICELKKKSRKFRSKKLTLFFKTGKGEYGEGDQFIGVSVPDIRIIAKKYRQADLLTIGKLLQSPIHEVRLCALLILTYKYPKADEKLRSEIYSFYLNHTKYINNWDLVDLSADKIVGQYLMESGMEIEPMIRFAKSTNLWERRIAMLSMFAFIKAGKLENVEKIIELLINDKHDLIQKAVGWMMREVGKRDIMMLERWLKKYAPTMPRTALRYAIEKMGEDKRKYYMSLRN